MKWNNSICSDYIWILHFNKQLIALCKGFTPESISRYCNIDHFRTDKFRYFCFDMNCKEEDTGKQMRKSAPVQDNLPGQSVNSTAESFCVFQGLP